ncbi:MAG: bifunctional riboflavin kinase/FAD synthetase [Anaerolineae bacterium]|nr:bifunctional riboflavin kinase/FAD synthetase [Anaerolineae bacterium]
MNHIYNLADTKLDQPSIVTIGVFDGVHRGHQHLISQLVNAAHSSGRLAVVLTLFPHPDIVLKKLTGRYYLTTPEQKAALLGDLGVDVVVTHPFDDTVRQIRAADFVDQLRAHLNMQSLWVTVDFAMGYKREGNFAFLTAQGAQKGFEVQEIGLLGNDSTSRISSSAIREALLAGDVEKAAHWLGRPYSIEGPVIHGDHRGRTIGFPTANIQVWDEQVLPANGVYAGWATLNGERFMTVMNVGERPTFAGKDIRVEAHLLDFDRDIYGQRLTVDFVARLRGEQKFSGLDALIQQIRADAERGRSILTSNLTP